MEDIRIYCEDDRQYHKVAAGTSLKTLADRICGERKVIAALSDNILKELDFVITEPHNIRFIDYDHPDGRRTYIRSLWDYRFDPTAFCKNLRNEANRVASISDILEKDDQYDN